jgi:RNA polymerase sigma factor (sigma-70 family)
LFFSENAAPENRAGGTNPDNRIDSGGFNMAGSSVESVLHHLHHLLESGGEPPDDRRLLQRFVTQRDQEAFAELVTRHGPLVFGMCRRVLRDLHDAEDVFQATFLVLARKAATIRKPESLSCFLHGVAYRLAIKARAEADRRRRHERRASGTGETEDADLSWREVRALIDEELQRLPLTMRMPLVLCYLEGQTQDEAARRLGWSRGTLKRRLERGRDRLRIRLSRRGVTLGASLFAVALTESASRGAVPASLRTTAVQAGMQFTLGDTTAFAVTRAARLAKGALQTMLTTKLKIGAMLMVLLGCAATAAGLVSRQTPAADQPKNRTEAVAPQRTAEDEKVRNDRYGDALPEGAMARLGTVRLRHQSMVASVVFTQDGKIAIAGDGDGNIVYWDVASGREVRRLRATPGVIHALAITADGKTLASGSWGKVFLWEVATGKLLSHEDVKNDAVMQLLFTPDGKTLAVRDQGDTILVWDVVGHKKLHELKGHKGRLSSMDLSPDGKTLVSGSWGDPHIRLWDVATGKEKFHFRAYDRDVVNVAFRPDGKAIASTGNVGGLRFWNLETGEKLHDQATFHLPMQLVYSPDGKFLVGSEGGGRLHAYDPATGKHLREFDAPPRTMSGLVFSSDSKTIATFWGGANTFDLWDAASGKLLHPFQGHRHYLTSLAFSADGQRLFSAAGISDYALRVWDTRTGEQRAQLGDNPNGVHGLALSPDGRLLAACGYNDNTIRLWDLARNKEVRSLKGHTSVIVSVAWSADGKSLVSGSYYDKAIRIWDPVSGKQLRVIQANQEWVGDVALSPDGETVAAGAYRDGSIRLWSVATGEEVRRIATPQHTVYALAFSPDGSSLASGGSLAGIHLWEPRTGRLLRQWDSPPGHIGHLAFSRDGRTLVSSHSDRSVRLWETATGKERAVFLGHNGSVRTVAFARDGRSIASGSDDTTILVWDTTVGTGSETVPSAERLQTLWADLSDTDARRAYRAIWRMALSPRQALPFLAEQLRPIPPLDAAKQNKVERLLADLDNERFAARQQAEAELEKIGAVVEPALRKALDGKPSLEVRRRMEKVLEKLASGRLRTTRALEAIEQMNTPEARQWLDTLANGTPRAWLTEEARKSRARLAD